MNTTAIAHLPNGIGQSQGDFSSIQVAEHCGNHLRRSGPFMHQRRVHGDRKDEGVREQIRYGCAVILCMPPSVSVIMLLRERKSPNRSGPRLQGKPFRPRGKGFCRSLLPSCVDGNIRKRTQIIQQGKNTIHNRSYKRIKRRAFRTPQLRQLP